MNEKEIKETKAIKVLFQKLLNDSYKQKEYRESLSFQEYHNDINRYIDDCIYNLSIPSKKMDLIFDELKIGMEISNWTIKVMDFGCTELRFVIDIFKSEGLFIRRPFF